MVINGSERAQTVLGWILIAVLIGSYMWAGIEHLHLIYAGIFIVASLVLSAVFVLLVWRVYRRR